MIENIPFPFLMNHSQMKCPAKNIHSNFVQLTAMLTDIILVIQHLL